MGAEAFDTSNEDAQQQAAAEFEQQNAEATLARDAAEQQAAQEQVRIYEYRGEQCSENEIRKKCPFLKNMGEAAFQKVIEAYEVPTVHEPIIEQTTEQAERVKQDTNIIKQEKKIKIVAPSEPEAATVFEQSPDSAPVQPPIVETEFIKKTQLIESEELDVENEAVAEQAVRPTAGDSVMIAQSAGPENSDSKVTNEDAVFKQYLAADGVPEPIADTLSVTTVFEHALDKIEVAPVDDSLEIAYDLPVEYTVELAPAAMPDEGIVPIEALPVVDQLDSLEVSVTQSIVEQIAEPTEDVEPAIVDLPVAEAIEAVTQQAQPETVTAETQPTSPETVAADVIALVEHVGIEAVEQGFAPILSAEVTEVAETFIANTNVAPERIEHLQNLTLLAGAGSSRLQELAIDGQSESPEAIQIQIKLAEWYEEILQTLEIAHTPMTVRDFVEQVIEAAAQPEAHTRLISEYEATHDYKRTFRGAHGITQDALQLLQRAKLGKHVLLASGLRLAA